MELDPSQNPSSLKGGEEEEEPLLVGEDEPLSSSGPAHSPTVLNETRLDKFSVSYLEKKYRISLLIIVSEKSHYRSEAVSERYCDVIQ